MGLPNIPQDWWRAGRREINQDGRRWVSGEVSLCGKGGRSPRTYPCVSTPFGPERQLTVAFYNRANRAQDSAIILLIDGAEQGHFDGYEQLEPWLRPTVIAARAAFDTAYAQAQV